MVKTLRIASFLIASIFIASGFNAFIRPDHALSLFEFSRPSTPAERNIVDFLLIIYGIRDIFMGLAIWSAIYWGTNQTLGAILVTGSIVAFVDGVACKIYAGKGEWTHWGYAPTLTLVGGLLFREN